MISDFRKMNSKENKLKVNLKLSINRYVSYCKLFQQSYRLLYSIKLLTAKQDQSQQHARKEIAGLLGAGKVESARIKVF